MSEQLTFTSPEEVDKKNAALYQEHVDTQMEVLDKNDTLAGGHIDFLISKELAGDDERVDSSAVIVAIDELQVASSAAQRVVDDSERFYNENKDTLHELAHAENEARAKK